MLQSPATLPMVTLIADGAPVPRQVVLLAPKTIAKTTSGKIQRSKVKQLYVNALLKPIYPIRYSNLGVAGGCAGGGGDAEGVNSGLSGRMRNQDGKQPRQDSEGKPPSRSNVHAEKQRLQNAKSAAQLEPETDRNALDNIVAASASAARSGIEAPMQARTAGSTCTFDIPHALSAISTPQPKSIIPTLTPHIAMVRGRTG